MLGQAISKKVFRLCAELSCRLVLAVTLVFSVNCMAAGSPSPQEGLFLFQRCAGLYYALSHYFSAVEGESGRELQQQMLADARSAETAAVHFRSRLHNDGRGEGRYSGELYADWRGSIHANALTIANQSYHLLQRAGVAVIAQDLAPCTELHPLQSAIARGDARL